MMELWIRESHDRTKGCLDSIQEEFQVCDQTYLSRAMGLDKNQNRNISRVSIRGTRFATRQPPSWSALYVFN